MAQSFFSLRRLRVTRHGLPAYDQEFHLGVNIIRGENGSGKSTIADFIFYAFGGEFDSWKAEARLCDEVQAEIVTRSGVLTVRRAIGSKTTPPLVFFGPAEEAGNHAVDGWQQFPLHRTAGRESFSQILFRASGIPESQSDGDSNITVHQILRLLYADQRTPAPRLFRFEQWDTHNMREAVGNLVCGLNVYEEYQLRIRLRDLAKVFEAKQKELSLRLAALPPEEGAANLASIKARLADITQERRQLEADIAAVDVLVQSDETKEFLVSRRKAVGELNRLKRIARKNEEEIETLELELSDLRRYMDFLADLIEKLPAAEASSKLIGNLEFTHCPSCLTPLAMTGEPDSCVVCGSKRDPERERSKYLQIRLDLDIQMRESHQLETTKVVALQSAQADQRQIRKEHDAHLRKFAEQFELSSSPRESFLAVRNSRIGSLDREIEYMSRLQEIAIDVQRLSEEKATIQKEIDELTARVKALAFNGDKRRRQALTSVSTIARRLLAADLVRQPEFFDAESVELSFQDDAVLVDGLTNFAESSNVILKNTAILSLFSAATLDDDFYHPRFLLMDNVEDKGMEAERSHNFQKLIIDVSNQAKSDHQIIFTTSTIDPSLEQEQFVIGPRYTHERRTLRIG